jgi:lysophospholipase L1-like esterase
VRRSSYVLLAALSLVGCDLFKNPSEPSVPSNIVNYVAIGASDAIGYGSSSPCPPIVPCTTGPGYVQQVARRLQSAGKTVTLTNLGIPGAVLSPETEALGDALGRDIFDDFLEREMPFVLSNTTLVTVFAGANDANTIGAAIQGGRAGSDIDGFVAAQISKFGQDMRTLVAGIKSRSTSGVRIVALNLPNLAALPYVSGLTLDEKRVLQRISVGFSAQINGLTSEGVRVIDLMCDGLFYNPSVLSADGFHPNDDGYTRLADLVYPVASTGSVTAPRASCSAMSQF